jgi:alanine racemase
VWSVVKADGYGHGAVDVGRAAMAAGARRLCVATVGEARVLRAALAGVPILILSPLAAGEEVDAAALSDCAVVIATPEGVKRLADAPPLEVHVKVDTGMGRWGLSPRDALELGRALAEPTARHRLGGLMTHFATADEDDLDFLHRQLGEFRLIAADFPPCLRHCANSAATLRVSDSHFDAVRPGIATYGVDPLGGDPERFGLEPVLRWSTVVRDLRTLAPGESTGYGRGFVAERPTRIALLPIGYADGYPRRLSTVGHVLIGGRRRRVVTTVSMDQMAALLEPDDIVAPGDEVVVIGRQGDERVLAEELAAGVGTNAYEIVCGMRRTPTRTHWETRGGSRG